VPTTLFLLTHRDRETHALYSELVNSEEFLASHVLRIPNAVSASAIPGKHLNGDGHGTLRESRNKAKQYTTLNGRTVILKESFLYSNKGRSRS
jgi:hypothetical protein